MTIAAIYARVSVAKPEQEVSDSVADQIDILTTLASEKDFEIFDVYKDDGVSGFKEKKRSGFDALLAGMDAKDFEIILVRHHDRFERKAGDFDLLKVGAVKNGIRWMDEHGTITDPATSGGGLQAGFASLMAAYESRVKSERLLDHYAKAAEKGTIQAPKGTYGYQDADRSKVEPKEAARIKAAYEAVDSGLTVGSVVTLWNEKRYPQRKGGTKWTYAHLNGILRRPRNAGLVFRDGQELEGVVGKWERIVEPELWRRVNLILSDENRRTSPGFKPVWLSSSTAKCGVCGSAMRSNTATDKRRGTRYPVIRCSAATSGERHASARLLDARDKEGNLIHRGLEPLVRAEVIRAFLWGGDSLLPKEKNIDVSALLSARTAISEEKMTVMSYRRDGLLTPAEERKQLTDLTVRSEAIGAQIEKARAEHSSAAMLVDLRDGFRYDGNRVSLEVAGELSHQLGERFDALHIEKRRLLVAELLDIVVAPGRGDKFVIVHRVVKGLNGQDEVT
jgi:site-specific DNA recombinase